MRPPGERARPYFIVVVVGFAVFLFACGAPAPVETGRAVEPPAAPDRTPALSSLAPPEPPPPSPVPTPVTTGPPEPRQAAGPVTFGTPEGAATDDASAREPIPPPFEGPVQGRVFTNKDLDRYRRVKQEFGFEEGRVTVDLTQPAAGEAPAESGGAPGADATAEERKKEDRETREKIAELTAEAEYLRKRIPSLHNPLLPRAAPSEADKIAEAGMDNAQRLEKVGARLAEVESEINGLLRRLAELHQKKPAGSDAPSP